MKKQNQTYTTLAAALLLLLFAGQASAQSMSTALRNGNDDNATFLPADDPYCGSNAIDTTAIPADLTPCQDITLTVVGDDGDDNTVDVPFPVGVVDWVLVEVRDTTDAGDAVASTAMARKPALLLSNGRVVDAQGFVDLAIADDPDRNDCLAQRAPDGTPATDDNCPQVKACLDTTEPPATGTDPCPAVSFGNAAFRPGVSPAVTNSAFLVVRHRNHLAVQANQAATGSNNSFSYDFSDNANKAYELGTKMRTVGGNTVFVLPMGDASADGLVLDTEDADRSIVASGQSGQSGYSLLDINMNGLILDTEDADRSIIASGNSGVRSEVRD